MPVFFANLSTSMQKLLVHIMDYNTRKALFRAMMLKLPSQEHDQELLNKQLNGLYKLYKGNPRSGHNVTDSSSDQDGSYCFLDVNIVGNGVSESSKTVWDKSIEIWEPFRQNIECHADAPARATEPSIASSSSSGQSLPTSLPFSPLLLPLQNQHLTETPTNKLDTLNLAGSATLQYSTSSVDDLP